MSKRKYPRLGSETKIPERKNKKCIVCGEKATFNVDVQWSWMRGDDDCENVCQVHRRDVAAIVKALL